MHIDIFILIGCASADHELQHPDWIPTLNLRKFNSKCDFESISRYNRAVNRWNGYDNSLLVNEV